MEPVLTKAASKLGIDQVAIRRINAPEGKAHVRRRPTPDGQREHVDERVREGSARQGRRALQLGRAQGAQRASARDRRCAASASPSSPHGAGSIGFDGLMTIKPDGRLYVQSGIGNLGTHSVYRLAPRRRRRARRCRGRKSTSIWGNTAKHLPYTCMSVGSQTTHAMTRANHAARIDAQAEAAGDRGEGLSAARPTTTRSANERVSGGGPGAA